MSARVAGQVLTRAALAVDASTPGVAHTVGQIVDLLVEAGARLDPRLVVLERDGHVTLATAEAPDGDPFIALPRAALIPIDRLAWDDAAPNVAVRDGLDSLTGLQRDLLALHLDLWNATRKREEFLQTHPKSAATGDEALLDALRAVRPSFAPDRSTIALLRTRTFALRVPRADASAEQPSTTTSVVMPILELADHHADGAAYRSTDDHLGADFRRIDDSGVTFVRYGPTRDALDMACQYGFCPPGTPYFVSAPLTLDLDGHGALEIGRALNRRSAPAWTADATCLRVSYLPLSTEVGLYDALVSPVRAFLESRGVDRAAARSLAIRASSTVLQLNAELVEAIRVRAMASEHGGAHVLAAASAAQLRVIHAVEALA